MQKVYLLLRNNQQNGPYSLEELLQFNLKPVDLIWIEGRSAGWYYPQEIPALQPHLSFVKQTTQPSPVATDQLETVQAPSVAKLKKVFVSMPVSAVLLKEEPFQTTSYQQPSFAKEAYTPSEPAIDNKGTEGLKTTYAKSLDEIETEYTNWVYQKKTKKRRAFSGRGVIAACLLIVAGVGGWWAVKSSSATEIKPAVSEQPATAIPSELPLKESVPAIKNETGVSLKSTSKNAKKDVIATTLRVTKPEIKNNSQEIVTIKKPVNNDDYEATIPGPAPVINKEVIEEKKSEPLITETPKEKKKLKEKIIDVFKKKKEEPVTEQPKTTAEENGERRAARREGSTNLATQLVVKFERPNEWMMGVKGAKALVTNRSNETISKALIEVSYYNEDNEVLQTRTISILNIGAKKTTTVSIPDHSFADHLDYKTISVVGVAEPFAIR